MEHVTTFTRDYEKRGTMSRDEVHREGEWHETFQCWVTFDDEEDRYVVLQLRSSVKRDFPALYDITAAGHLTAGEQAADGVREMEEEIGLQVTMADLRPLGRLQDEIEIGAFLDREHCHVFQLHTDRDVVNRLQFRDGEADGACSVKLEEFQELIAGVRSACSGISDTGRRLVLAKEDLVPHSSQYWEQVMPALKEVNEEE
ncbi:NUDIX hydrolase [Alkalicoccus luteus]|uniref:NUDIX hydrolase n=1 Tax=Alkalicoccus luteus TaxID=1237094 RepID=UPI0040341F00